jgi:hypothetical protein
LRSSLVVIVWREQSVSIISTSDYDALLGIHGLSGGYFEVGLVVVGMVGTLEFNTMSHGNVRVGIMIVLHGLKPESKK